MILITPHCRAGGGVFSKGTLTIAAARCDMGAFERQSAADTERQGCMYGTIQHVRLKEGAEPAYKTLMEEFEARLVPGFMGHYMYRLDAKPGEYMVAVVFSSRDAYVANAGSPEMHALYQRMAAVFDRESEWFDGEIADVRGMMPRE